MGNFSNWLNQEVEEETKRQEQTNTALENLGEILQSQKETKSSLLSILYKVLGISDTQENIKVKQHYKLVKLLGIIQQQKRIAAFQLANLKTTEQLINTKRLNSLLQIASIVFLMLLLAILFFRFPVNEIENLSKLAPEIEDLASSKSSIDLLAKSAVSIDYLANSTASLDKLARSSFSIDRLAESSYSLDLLAGSSKSIDRLSRSSPSLDQLSLSTRSIDRLAFIAPSIERLSFSGLSIDRLALSSSHIDRLALSSPFIDRLTLSTPFIDRLAGDITSLDKFILRKQSPVTIVKTVDPVISNKIDILYSRDEPAGCGLDYPCELLRINDLPKCSVGMPFGEAAYTATVTDIARRLELDSRKITLEFRGSIDRGGELLCRGTNGEFSISLDRAEWLKNEFMSRLVRETTLSRTILENRTSVVLSTVKLKHCLESKPNCVGENGYSALFWYY